MSYAQYVPVLMMEERCQYGDRLGTLLVVHVDLSKMVSMCKQKRVDLVILPMTIRTTRWWLPWCCDDSRCTQKGCRSEFSEHYV